MLVDSLYDGECELEYTRLKFSRGVSVAQLTATSREGVEEDFFLHAGLEGLCTVTILLLRKQVACHRKRIVQIFLIARTVLEISRDSVRENSKFCASVGNLGVYSVPLVAGEDGSRQERPEQAQSVDRRLSSAGLTSPNEDEQVGSI